MWKKNNASECFELISGFERLRRQQFQLNLSAIANFFLLDYHKVYGLDNEITLTYYKRKK